MLTVPKKIQDANKELEQLLVSGKITILCIWRELLLTENQHVKAVKGENMLKLFQQAAGMEIRITDGELNQWWIYL